MARTWLCNVDTLNTYSYFPISGVYRFSSIIKNKVWNSNLWITQCLLNFLFQIFIHINLNCGLQLFAIILIFWQTIDENEVYKKIAYLKLAQAIFYTVMIIPQVNLFGVSYYTKQIVIREIGLGIPYLVYV